MTVQDQGIVKMDNVYANQEEQAKIVQCQLVLRPVWMEDVKTVNVFVILVMKELIVNISFVK